MKKLGRLIILTLLGVLTLVPAFAQQTDKIIKKKQWRSEPIKILSLKLQGKKVKFNQKFITGNDWFRDLNVDVKNISSQAVAYISLGMTFSPDETTQKIVSSSDLHLTYGHHPTLLQQSSALSPNQSALQPNETATIPLRNYENLREFLSNSGYSQTIKEFEVDIREVIYTDGTKWSRGELLKQDPNNPGSWVPIQSLYASFHRLEQEKTFQFQKINFNPISIYPRLQNACRAKTGETRLNCDGSTTCTTIEHNSGDLVQPGT